MTVKQNDEILLDTLQTEYPEVFDSAIRSRVIKHSIVASVEMDTNEPVIACCLQSNTEPC